MEILNVVPLESVNGVAFGASKEEVRKVFGPTFFNSADKVKETVNSICKTMEGLLSDSDLASIAGFELDCDTYVDVQMDYRQEKFVAITIYVDFHKYVKIGDKKIPVRKIKKIKELADDFVWSECVSAWVSKSKQIRVICSGGPKKINSICFGCADQFN